MSLEADFRPDLAARGRHHEIEFRLLHGTLYSIFLTSALIRRLVPWKWRRSWRKGRSTIFQEAKASTDRITPMVFTG